MKSSVVLRITVLLAVIFVFIKGFPFNLQQEVKEPRGGELSAGIKALLKQVQSLQENNRKLKESIYPDDVYIVVDTHNNELLLRKGDRVLRKADCSTGKGDTLTYEGKRWVFRTPRGAFKVLKKEVNPTWIKPVWAFVERKEKPPVLPESFRRFEYGVLGKYALDFGEGYKIHGTLYEIRLGQSVTHGCIRLGSEDLKAVFNSVSVGTPIYIY